jgi:hypothetical protein
MQSVLLAGLLGAVGGLLLELVELGRFIKKYGHVPWSRRSNPRVVRVDGELRRWESQGTYLFAVVIRMVVGAVVAAGLSLAGPLSPVAAMVSGVGAYSVIDRWASGADVNIGAGPPAQIPNTTEKSKSVKSPNTQREPSAPTAKSDPAKHTAVEETVPES